MPFLGVMFYKLPHSGQEAESTRKHYIAHFSKHQLKWKRKKTCKDFIYLFIYFLERERGREGEREKETSMRKRYFNWLPLPCPQLGAWPATQACALTGNQTSNLSVCGPVLNPLSHTSQDEKQKV